MKATNNGEANTMDRQRELEAIEHAAAQVESNPASPYEFSAAMLEQLTVISLSVEAQS